ncbi:MULTISPECIES: phBC6A51 family helix-turn-helix protein [Peribacillus]|uniref:phBC6A51 family helix-turn-helix protein n=1 Tax=Peribacillus TaxID=2675229 RepID=UPI001F4EE5BC|nr:MULTISPECIES: phBC6A51 family helix-turn-helix protein [unclassified Peribacillus]MCK1985179.1 phBC6A51 family helix-turn-helix protein [Peribacillus sp. Aquil_B1]MCK2007171.1 phBC6A51 family helix-turn-helix protein [Peribacillus sp. Aquil_B8]
MTLSQLGPEHYKAMALLATPKRGGLTFEQIAKECDIHVNTLLNWRKDPLFEREFKREVIRGTQDRLPEMMDAMINAVVEDRNAAAAKLILTANDMLTDRVEVNAEVSTDKSLDAVKARIAAMRKTNESTTEE